MNAFLSRCRHARVHWLSTHSCRCLQCGKTGRWFETEGLVMWTRDQKSHEANPVRTNSLPLATNLEPVANLSSRAG